MHLSSAIPWGGGTPGKFNVEWGLIRGFERLTYPGGGGNEGGLFPKALHRGENRGLWLTFFCVIVFSSTLKFALLRKCKHY